jgi:hypothetical protein
MKTMKAIYRELSATAWHKMHRIAVSRTLKTVGGDD